MTMTTPAPPKPPLAPYEHTGLDITALVCAFVLPVLGLILGWTGIAYAHRQGRQASGLSIGAVILSVLSMIAVIVAVSLLLHHPAPQSCDPSSPLWPNC